jgi:hypothetical protein
MGADVLRHRVDIAERALQRAGCVQRTSTAGDIHQINRLHRAVDSVRGSQPHERPRFHRHFTGRQKVGPKLMEAIEQKKAADRISASAYRADFSQSWAAYGSRLTGSARNDLVAPASRMRQPRRLR